MKEQMLTENPSADQLQQLQTVIKNLTTDIANLKEGLVRDRNLQLSRERPDKEIGAHVVEHNITDAIIKEIPEDFRSGDPDHRHHPMISLILAGAKEALFEVSLCAEPTESVIENIATDIDAMKEGIVRDIRAHLADSREGDFSPDRR